MSWWGPRLRRHVASIRLRFLQGKVSVFPFAIDQYLGELLKDLCLPFEKGLSLPEWTTSSFSGLWSS